MPKLKLVGAQVTWLSIIREHVWGFVDTSENIVVEAFQIAEPRTCMGRVENLGPAQMKLHLRLVCYAFAKRG